MAKKLVVELNPEFAQASDVVNIGANQVAVTPPIGEDYWLARVKLLRGQAIVCFPKFFTVGCGFAQETDWNTNLPLRTEAKKIFAHIKHNKKFSAIKDADCIEAIELLQKAVLPIFDKKLATA